MSLNKSTSVYVVETSNKNETLEVLSYISGGTRTHLNINYTYVAKTYTKIGSINGQLDNFSVDIMDIWQGLPIITFEEWKNLPETEFILPEKWAVKNNGYEELSNYANKYGAYPPYTNSEDSYFNFPVYDGKTTSWRIFPGYTEITFEQFKKYVLNMEDKTKPIIEYRVKEEFKKVSKALYETFYRDSYGGWARFDFKSTLRDQYEKVGVLDIWFDKVYELPKLPKINGYDGKVEGEYLIYGRAKLPISWFSSISSEDNRQIKRLDLSSDVKIDQIQMDEIRKYLASINK